MGEIQLFEGDSCAHYTKGSNSRSSRLSLHLSSPRVHWFSGLKRHHTMTNLDLLDYESQTCWWNWIADPACCLPLAKNGSYAVPEPVLVWNQWIARPPEFQQVIKVCDRECDKAEAGGGRREARAGYRIKSKNPTQRCGEQLFKLERDPSSLQFSKLSHFNPKLNRLHLYIYRKLWKTCEKCETYIRVKIWRFQGLITFRVKIWRF